MVVTVRYLGKYGKVVGTYGTPVPRYGTVRYGNGRYKFFIPLESGGSATGRRR